MSNRLKSAEELGLPKNLYCGLVKTLHALEHDTMPHKFRMNVWHEREAWGACGTACCIGGTAEVMMGAQRYSFAYNWSDLLGKAPIPFYQGAKGEALRDLFYPWCDCAANYLPGRLWTQDATPAQGARALRSYLTTGHANWDAAED